MIHMSVGLEAMMCVSNDVVCVKLCVYVVCVQKFYVESMLVRLGDS